MKLQEALRLLIPDPVNPLNPDGSHAIDMKTVTMQNFCLGCMPHLLAPWKKSYDQPRQHIQSRDITWPAKVRLVKAVVFPVVMYGCESWTTQKAEHQRIDAFELWCWRRLLRVPWTARRSNQSILKDIRIG